MKVLIRFLPILLLVACAESVDTPSDPPGVSSNDTSRGDLDLVEPRGDALSAAAKDEVETQGADTSAGADSGPPPLPLVEGTHVWVDAQRRALVLAHDGDERLSIPFSALLLGSVPVIDEELNYDPYYLEPGDDFEGLYSEPAGLTWSAVSAAEESESAQGESRFVLTLEDGREAGLVITHPGPGRAHLHWSPPSDGDPVVFFRLSPQIDASEGLYGLGEVFDHVNHRGHVRAMQIEIAELESGYNEVHVPIPFVTGTTGWGLFVESMRPGVFACATDDDTTMRVTFGLREEASEGLSIHLFSAEHPLDIVSPYYDVTGRPGPIAQWAMGPWIWRDEVKDQAAVEADLSTIRELDLATTGYWIDRPYASAVNSFDFKPSDYPDPAAMMASAERGGFAMALWHTPYTDPDEPASLPLYEEASEAGYFAPVGTTGLAKWGPPVDFTNPAAMSWWKSLLGAYKDLGFVGYKLDYGEEVVVGAFGNRLPWLFHDGSNELTMHRGYQLLYHEAYAAMLPDEGGFLLCRAGTYGDQAQGVIIWPGDIDATLAMHGDTVTKDGKTYVSVGGLHAAVVAGSSLGPSGFPFFGSDTGGYRNAPPERETYIRWFQHTALSPIMQVGTNSNDLPWSFGKDKVLDEEMLALYRDFARLHLRLHPYLWTYVEALQTEGRAIQRPLGLAHPELGWHGDDIYMLGDHLLVAPVTRAGVIEREIPLPEGEWVDWWTGEVVMGGETVTRPAPLETLPVLVRAGALVPLLRPDIDTLLPVSGEFDEVVSLSPPGTEVLHVRTSPGPASSFVLHDGAIVAQRPHEGGLSVEWAPGERFGAEVVFEIAGLGEAPEAVSEGEWTWSEEGGGTLQLRLSATELVSDVSF